MAVQCPPPAYSVLEGTNGNYEPLRSRLASRGPFGSGISKYCRFESLFPLIELVSYTILVKDFVDVPCVSYCVSLCCSLFLAFAHVGA